MFLLPEREKENNEIALKSWNEPQICERVDTIESRFPWQDSLESTCKICTANLQELPSYGRARTKSSANIFHVNQRQILALVLTRQNNCLKYYNASTIYYIHGMNFALSALANIQIQTFKIYVLILLRKSYLIGDGINCYRSTFIFYKTSCYIKVDKIS